MTARIVNADRFGGRPRWRPGRASDSQLGDLVGAEWVGSGAQQLAGIHVEEHQRGRFDADLDPASGEDLLATRTLLPRLTVPPGATQRSTSTAPPSSIGDSGPPGVAPSRAIAFCRDWGGRSLQRLFLAGRRPRRHA